MPNWYHNTLFVMGKPEEVAAFKLKAAERVPFEEPSPLSFHNFVPRPPEILALEFHEFSRNEWEGEHWGCKWGATFAEIEEEYPGLLIYHFSTAWGPPVTFFKQLAKLYPNLIFRLETYSMDPANAFHFIFMGDVFHVTDRSWIIEAQWRCTCGAWAPKKKKRNVENLAPAPRDREQVIRDESPAAQADDTHQATSDPSNVSCDTPSAASNQ
jgi:hypothetical protein